VKDNVSPVITPRPAWATLQVQARRAVLRRCRAGHPADVVRRLARVADQVGQVRIPMPFSRIAIAIGPPCYVPRVTDAPSLTRLQSLMEQELKRLYGVRARPCSDPADSVKCLKLAVQCVSLCFLSECARIRRNQLENSAANPLLRDGTSRRGSANGYAATDCLWEFTVNGNSAADSRRTSPLRTSSRDAWTGRVPKPFWHRCLCTKSR